MKKLLALLLALAMIFALAACGEGKQEPEEQKTEPTSASAEKTEPSETEPSETEPSAPEATDSSEDASTAPSESEATDPTTEPTAPSESEVTDPTTEPTAPSESEVTDPTTEPTAPSESEVTDPTTEPTAPSESEVTDPTTEPTVPSETDPTTPSVSEGIDPDLIGTWVGSITADGAMMDMPELDATLTIKFTMAFGSNGMCTMTLDEEALREELPAFLDAMIPVAVEAFYEEMGGEEAAEEAMMEMAGMTVTEYFEAMLSEESMEEMIFGSLEETSMTAAYTIEDGQIVIDGEGVDYVVEGDKLILTDEDLADFDMESVELTRIDASDPNIPEVPDDPDDPEIPVEPGTLDEALFGTWSGAIVADGTMMGLPELDASLAVPMSVSFGEDGYCTMTLDEDGLRESLADFIDSAIPYMVEMIYEESGGEEAAEEAMMLMTGMTVTEYCESMFTEDMLMETILGGEDISETMEYYVADGMLYMGEEASEYTVEGDKLILSGGDLAEGLAEMGVESLELTKVA